VKYLTPEQIAAALPLYRYKPGWHVSCHEQPYDTFPYEGFCVDVRFEVPNAYHAQDMQVQNVHVPVPPIVDTEHLYDFLTWRLARLELHELREFVWVDGKIRDNPHEDRTFV
jgi:hypothetical protein